MDFWFEKVSEDILNVVIDEQFLPLGSILYCPNKKICGGVKLDFFFEMGSILLFSRYLLQSFFGASITASGLVGNPENDAHGIILPNSTMEPMNFPTSNIQAPIAMTFWFRHFHIISLKRSHFLLLSAVKLVRLPGLDLVPIHNDQNRIWPFKEKLMKQQGPYRRGLTRVLTNSKKSFS